MFNQFLKGLNNELLLLLFKEAYLHAERMGITVDEIEKQKPNRLKHWGCYDINLTDFWKVFDRYFRNPYGLFTEDDAVAVLDWIGNEIRNETWSENILGGIENYVLDSDRLAFCQCQGRDISIVGIDYPYCLTCAGWDPL